MKDNLGDYQRLPNDNEGNTQSGPTQGQKHNVIRRCGAIVLIFLALILGVAIGSTRFYESLSLSEPKITHCGHTSSEARARGCVLEPMVYGWMPPHCQYPEVTQSNNMMQWPWYADENMTQSVNEEEVWNGEFLVLWTNKPLYHTQHCLFLYRKLMYGMEHKVKWLDKKTLGSDHAYHCVERLSEAPEGEHDITFVELGIYACEKTLWS